MSLASVNLLLFIDMIGIVSIAFMYTLIRNTNVLKEDIRANRFFFPTA